MLYIGSNGVLQVIQSAFLRVPAVRARLRLPPINKASRLPPPPPPGPRTAFASECVHPRHNVHARAHSHPHRHQGLSIYRPIIYGNTAVVLTPKEREALSTPDHTHRWTVAIRSAASAPDSDIVGGADDLSYFVKRVTFKLHDTYTNPNRSECVCDCSKLVCS